MYRTTMLKFAVIGVLASVFGLASSARGQAFDSDPQNPDNWVVNSVKQGRELGHRKEYQWNLGVRSTHSTTWQRLWGNYLLDAKRRANGERGAHRTVYSVN